MLNLGAWLYGLARGRMHRSLVSNGLTWNQRFWRQWGKTVRLSPANDNCWTYHGTKVACLPISDTLQLLLAITCPMTLVATIETDLAHQSPLLFEHHLNERTWFGACLSLAAQLGNTILSHGTE